MKLLLVVRWPVGGIRTYINYVYSEWNGDLLEIDLIAPNLPDETMPLINHQGITVNFHKTQSANPSITEFSQKVHSVTKHMKFDLIHAHGFTSGVAIAWKLPFLRTPSILTSHDVLNTKQFQGISGNFKAQFLPLLFNRFDVIHSVSKDAQNNLTETLPRVSRKKCIVIKNGVDTEKFSTCETYDLRQELHISLETKILGFFGRFMSQKGFKYLVEAMELLNEKYPNKYKVVCFGGGGFIREEKASLKRRGLDHLFHFYDFIPNIASYIRACDVVVAPSLWEACPLLPMEVLCSGTPLVASKCIGQREVCDETPAIMVEPADASSLVEGIIAADVASLERFQSYSPEAQHRFDIRETRRKVRELYNRLLEAA